jgi:hypothetical protein
VPQEIASVQRRIALTVQVQVKQVEARTVRLDVVRVIVAVNPARPRLRDGCAQPLTRLQEAFQTSRPRRPLPGHGRQPLAQDAQFVRHRVAAVGRHPGAVKLVGRFRDPAGQPSPARPGQ